MHVTYSNSLKRSFQKPNPKPSQPAEADESLDSGLACLLVMSNLHGVAADAAQLRHIFGAGAFGHSEILLAAKHLGLKSKCVVQDALRLDRVLQPAIAEMHDGSFLILAGLDSTKAEVLLEQAGQPPALRPLDQFMADWTGRLYMFTSKLSFATEISHFDFTWFIPAVVKYRRALIDVLLISLVLQLIGLATPLFFQVVMDKVLVNQAMKTLHVIGIGLIGAIIFEAILSAIRMAVLARTSSKMDVELGAGLFRHLLQLPVSYFQVRRVGDRSRACGSWNTYANS